MVLDGTWGDNARLKLKIMERQSRPSHIRPYIDCCCPVARHVQFFVTPWTTALQTSLCFNISQSLLKLMPIESVMPCNNLILCHPLLFLPQSFPTSESFSSELALGIRWPEYWSFSFNISPSNEHLRLISSRIDWFGLLSVQSILKSLPT